MSRGDETEPLAEVALGECRVTLLGTAHVSRISANKVRELLVSNAYDAVAVELCPSRYNALVDPDALARMDLFKVIRRRKLAMVAASLALSAYQRRLAEQLGLEPGAEMRAAVETARERGLPVLLVDREIGVTLRRIYRGVPWWKRLSLLSGILASIVSREQISEAQIERLKEGDVLETTFSEFATEERELYGPLIGERDRYMAARLRQGLRNGDYCHVLTVIGAGHLKGVVHYLGDDSREPGAVIAELERVPNPSPWPRIVPWLVVGVIVVGFAIGFARSSDLGWQMVSEWVVINGGLAAIGAFFAAAHPVTVIGAFLAAPLTSLNPTVGAGMVCAAIETFMRKPTVADFGGLRADTAHLRGWWRNRVARILLVFLFSTLGSAFGTYLAGFRIYERLVGA